MCSRLLVSAAVLVAGLAVASAQNAPASGQEYARNQTRNQHHRSPAAASRKAEQSPRTRATRFQDATKKGLNNPGRSGRGTAASGESATSMGRHGARGDVHPPAKHNHASVLPSRRQRHSAMGQEPLRPERDRRLPGHRQQASPPPKERGHEDVARNRTPRRPTGQRIALAGDRRTRGSQDHHGGRNQTRGVALHRAHHQGGAPKASAGQDQVRKVQTALNRQGFSVGDPDGKLGKRTKEALIAFQKQGGFQTTGKIDRTTLHALLAAGPAPSGNQPNPAPVPQSNPAPAPIQTAPQGIPPATTGRGDAAPEPVAPAQRSDGETPPAQDGRQMPDASASGRVPASSPQEDYKEDTAPPAGDDHR